MSQINYIVNLAEKACKSLLGQQESGDKGDRGVLMNVWCSCSERGQGVRVSGQAICPDQGQARGFLENLTITQEA